MNPKITALGTGTADSVKYFQTSFYISDTHTNLLIDTGGGSGILSQLDKFNISLNDIQNVFITHKHIDHIFGIFWILRFRGAAIHSGKAPNLTIYASEKNITLIKEVSTLFLKEKVITLFDKKIRFIPINNTPSQTINNWSVQFFDTQSKKEEQWGCAVTFDNNRKLVFIGDESYTSPTSSFCVNADYFFHDAYCLEKDRNIFNPHEISHSTAKEAGRNAEIVKAKNLIIFHTEDQTTWGNRKNLYSIEVKEEYSGNVFVPDDGEVIQIK